MNEYTGIWDYCKLNEYTGIWDYCKLNEYTGIWDYCKLNEYTGIWAIKECPICHGTNLEPDAIQVSLSQRKRFTKCLDCNKNFIRNGNTLRVMK